MDSNETASLAPSESENLSKNTISVNAGSVSDGEGYPSGQEEFETASEDSATVETVGEDNFDEPFVDAPSDVELLPADSEVENVNDDDDVENFSNNDVEGDEFALEKGDAVVVDELDLDLDEMGDGDSGKLVVDEVEMNGGDESRFDVSSSGAAVVEKIGEDGDVNNEKDAKEVVEPENSEVVNHGVDSEEDCVVDDGIQVGGDGKIDENGDVANESDAKEVIETEENAIEDNKFTSKSVTNGEIGADSDENQLHRSNGGLEDELVLENGVNKEVQFIKEFDQTPGVDISEQEEEGGTDDEGEDEKELFDSAALSALLKAATGADGGGNITITSRDGTRLFTIERPAGPGSSLRALRPAPQPNPFSPTPSNIVGVSEESLSEEEKNNLEKLQQIRVKFLRLIHRLGLSPDEPVAAQVLYRLALLGGRKGTGIFSLDAAKNMALQLEAEESDNLDFSVNLLILGKSGVGKSATINSIFSEEKLVLTRSRTGRFLRKKFLDSLTV